MPTDLKDLSRLPDEDGSIAAALANLDVRGYKATSEMAALPSKEPRPLRGGVIMNASINSTSDDAPSEGLTFTTYDLPLAGEDKLFNTEDDLIVRDGVIWKASEVVRRTTAKAPVRP